MVDIEKEVSLDTVYRYTERCIDGCSRNFNGLRNRIGLFIGAGSVLVRLSLDLPNTPVRVVTVLLSAAVVIYSSFSLKPEDLGESANPAGLLDDDFFYQGEEFHKGGIVNDWLKSLEVYESAISRKQGQLWGSICLFCTAIAFYSLGVILG